jgi:hypothetical protein
LVASTAVLQAGPNAVGVNSVAGTTVTGALGVTGQTTTAGLGNTGLLANTGDFTNSGAATIGGATQINNTLRVTGDTTIGVVDINATTGLITGASLGIKGLSTTNGITNNGSLTNTGNVTIGGNTSIGGNLAVTGKQITLGAADGTSTVTIPGIASRSGGQRFVATDDAGNLSASQYTINDYNSALKQVDQQVSQVGAIAAALTAIPNLTSGTSTYGCGIGTGAFGSSWAGAAGCVAKVSDNIWVNGALSYSPSVSTPFGSTPSVAGRLGIFFQF